MTFFEHLETFSFTSPWTTCNDLLANEQPSNCHKIYSSGISSPYPAPRLIIFPFYK